MCHTLLIPQLPLGKRYLSLVGELDVYETPLGGDCKLVQRVRRVFDLETEVLPDEPPDYITFKSSSELDQAVRACIGPIEAYTDERTLDDGRQLYIMIPPVTVPPIGLAFDALAEVDGRLLPLGPCSFSSQEAQMGKSLVTTLTGASPRTITVILKSSKDTAMLTVDLFEIWEGELRFEDVEVGRPP